MKGTCEKCGRTFSFETENIEEFSATFRCKSCRHVGKASHHEPDQRPFVALEDLEYETDTEVVVDSEKK